MTADGPTGRTTPRPQAPRHPEGSTVSLDDITAQMKPPSQLRTVKSLPPVAPAIGVETATPMNDLIEVGVFAPGKTNPLYLMRHRIRTGNDTLRIILPQEPSTAGVLRPLSPARARQDRR